MAVRMNVAIPLAKKRRLETFPSSELSRMSIDFRGVRCRVLLVRGAPLKERPEYISYATPAATSPMWLFFS